MKKLYQLVPVICMFLIFAGHASAGRHTMNAEEVKLFRLVTKTKLQERSKAKLDPILCKVARKRAAEMAAQNYFSHLDPKGNGPNLKAKKAGYRFPAFYPVGRESNTIESIAAGSKGPNEIVKLWAKSQGHRTHIFGLSSFYREQTRIGVGVALAPKTGVRTYVFISAPPNLNPKPPYLVLRNPSGKVLATTGSPKNAATNR